MSAMCKHIDLMKEGELKCFLDSFDTVLSDCDGVLWAGGKTIEGSPEVIRQFRSIGKKVIFVTNNGMSRQDLLNRCHQLGYEGTIDEMITSSYLCALYLSEKNFTKTVYVFGGEGLVNEFDRVGIKHIGVESDPMPAKWDPDIAEHVMEKMENNIGCVVVGYNYDVSYMKLLKAATYLQNPNVLFVGTNSDPMFPLYLKNRKCIMPATGSFIAAVQTASGKQPLILGKPHLFMFEAVKKAYPEIQPERTLMIGDRADTDVVFGKNCGLATLMVGTGTNSIDDIRDWELSDTEAQKILIPNYFVTSLGAIFQAKDLSCALSEP